MAVDSAESDRIERVVSYYRRLILSGQIADSERMPDYAVMQERHGFSRAAAEEVYRHLYEMRLITRDPGPQAST